MASWGPFQSSSACQWATWWGGISGPIGILAALHERHRTGKGRLIDVSLMDGLIGLLGYVAQLAFFTGEDPVPQGSQHPNLVPYGAFPASDGAIIIACLTNGFWSRICEALGFPEAAMDPEFDSLEKRRDIRDRVNEMIAVKTRERSIADLVTLFTHHQVPHAPILGVTQALSQPQALAREMVVETQHATLGAIPIVNRSIRYPGSPQPIPAAPPALGEHCDAILREVLGFSSEQILDLRRQKVVS